MSAIQIVRKIVRDIQGRSQIGNVWDSIDLETQESIKRKWEGFIEGGLDETDHWVDFGKEDGYICSCPVGQDHLRPQVGATLLDSAITIHEWYSSLKEAGFTEDQALYLVGQAITAQLKGGPDV